MKQIVLFLLLAISVSTRLYSQTCTATSFDYDLSASIDTTVSMQSTRNGDCCNGNNCIKFNLTLNPACSYVNFTVINPAPPGNAAYYQIDCGPQTSLGTPICIIGKTNVVITFCKPGNDNPIYTITAAGALKGSDDITVREGCTGTMSIAGLITSTINWTSIYPGAEGAYDSYLSCTSGCVTTNVAPPQGAPSYIDYKVSGNRLCGSVVNDTIRVYSKPQIAVAISPNAPSVCAGGSTNVTLTATPSGGDAPYNYVWSNGQTGNSITVNMGATYSVSVTDIYNCLPATQTKVVTTTPLPAAPILSSNSPVCEGSTINLFASTIAGATYSWTGPGGFTSSLQNPVINNATAANAGSYSVIVTVGQCSSATANTSVVVNAIPASPTASTNSPVCEGTALNLSASSTPGGIYAWTGPNGFSSSAQNPVINNAGLVNAGTYNVTVKLNGCTSAPSSATAVINSLPAAPLAGSNSPLCAGSSISLTAGSINGASYSWTGPTGFTSSLQNPTINNAGTTASGIYSVKATVNGCTGSSATTTVTVNPIPSAPALSSNGPVCEASTLLLNASTIAGASYQWSGPGEYSSSVQNPSIANPTIAASGTYSATVTVNGCTSAAGNIAVVINPIPAAPVISGNSGLCEGATLSLSASVISGGSYSWSGPNGFSSNGQNITIANTNASQSGAYSVNATVNGCSSQSATSNVTISSVPLAPSVSSNSPVCSGNSISLNASTVAGATYNWTGPNGFISSIQNPVINNSSLTEAGSYNVTVSVGGCSSLTTSSTVVAVNQTPIAPVANNNGPVCDGANLNLSASLIAGASYSWSGPNNFISTSQNPVINNSSLQNAGTYNVTVTANGCTSAASSTIVVINALPAAPVVGSNSPLCDGNTISLTAGSINGASYSWSGPNGFSSLSQNPTIANAAVNASGIYSVKAIVNGCTGATGTTSVTIHAIPSSPNASYNGPVCEGSTVSLTASTIAGASYAWTGPNGYSSSAQNPSVSNSTIAASGSYAVTATVNGCTSATNAILVTINAIPAPPVISGNASLCEGSSLLLNASSVTGASYSWSGPNGFITASQNASITNTTPAHSGVYSVTATVNGCTSQTANSNVVITSVPVAPSISSNSPVCSGNSISLNAAAVANAVYSWTGPNGFTSSVQNPVINNASLVAAGSYQLSITLNGCSSTNSSSANIVVNQTPNAPVANNNGPVCEGGSLILSASNMNGATYSWSGPGGYSASSQNISLSGVTAANAGNYSVAAMVNGCTSTVATTAAVIHKPAIVNPGTDQTICSSNQFANLSGNISAGNGGVWTSDGTGTFSPDNTNLNAKYYPSAGDKATGKITLKLSSTNNGACPVSSSSLVINFASMPSATAGNNQVVCANDANVSLKGQFSNAEQTIWSTSGSGSFSPSAASLIATYIPSNNDKTNGSVKLALTTVGNGTCVAASNSLTVTIKTPPAIKTESVKYVVEDNSILLNPAVSGVSLKYSWTPATYLNKDTVANPLCIPKADVSYRLTTKDAFGCVSSADVVVKVLKHPEIPNVFTPNGDGINDKWQIKHLTDYTDCTVEIYNRYGQVVYQGVGYSTAWDGTSKGKPLPAGTYYYIINQKMGLKPVAGFVDIVK